MPLEFGEHLSPTVAAAVPKAVEMALFELEKKLKVSNWSNERLT